MRGFVRVRTRVCSGIDPGGISRNNQRERYASREDEPSKHGFLRFCGSVAWPDLIVKAGGMAFVAVQTRSGRS
jgi:hypothetical protein